MQLHCILSRRWQNFLLQNPIEKVGGSISAKPVRLHHSTHRPPVPIVDGPAADDARYPALRIVPGRMVRTMRPW